MITVYRLIKSIYAQDGLTGEGAKQYPGRWNHHGYPMIYCAATLSLAALELLANLDTLPSFSLTYLQIDIPTSLVQTSKTLPAGWNNYPKDIASQDFGTHWLLKKQTAVLKVPSVIIPIEFNYLINPLHSDFTKIKLMTSEPFSFDERFFKSG